MQIKIVYCFDEKLTIPLPLVSAASLLDYTKDKDVHYDFYCVCTNKAAVIKDKLEAVIKSRDPESNLIMRPIDNPFEDSYKPREITTGTYIRLILPSLLSDVDKIIYMDVDILCRDDLKELWEMDIDDYLITGVKGAVNLTEKWEWNATRDYWHYLDGAKGSYINAGVTIQNLKKMREVNIESEWNKWKEAKLYYMDQDIMNITCKGQVGFIPMRYNFLAYNTDKEREEYLSEGVFSAKEYDEAAANPAVIHYAGDKPWYMYCSRLGNLWWDYVDSQADLKDLFDEEAARKNTGLNSFQKLLRRIKKLFSKEKL